MLIGWLTDDSSELFVLDKSELRAADRPKYNVLSPITNILGKQNRHTNQEITE
jgi:hypothetical protein